MKRLKSVVDVLATLLVVIAAGLVIWRQFIPAASSRRPPRIESAKGTLPAELARTALGSGQVALVEFADFECPFCGRHAREVEPMIRKTFVDTGVVREVFVNLPLPIHAHAGPASEAAMCAGQQGKFWGMYDALFQDQKGLEASDLTARADKIGLDSATLAECQRGGKARAEVERHKKVAAEMKVQATPAFFVGLVQSDGSIEIKKRLNGALPFADFRTAIVEVAPAELRSRIPKVAFNAPQDGVPNAF